MEKGKSTNTLMKHIRTTHGINIGGSNHKKMLLRMGYYHGYKGYRFYLERRNVFSFSHFDEIIAVYNFDTALKDLLFSPLVSIETSIKNYILDELVSGSNPTFESIYSEKLTDYHRFSGQDKTIMLNNRLNLQKNIHSSVHMNYGKNKMVTHKINSGEPIPLWVMFEIISLGKLGDFVKQMHKEDRKAVLMNLGIYDRMDTNADHLTNHIFILNELRNGIAHNHIIFDTRFKNRKINNTLLNDLRIKFGITNVSFKSIVDYLSLIIMYLKALGYSKTELKRLTREFKRIVVDLKNVIPTSEFNRILGTDVLNKLAKIDIYI